MTSLRIDVPSAEFKEKVRSPEIEELRERLSATPTKDPEELAKQLASRAARNAMLQKLELEAKLARAKRSSDLVKENRARKLRMEAAAVARASSKIEKASMVESTRRQEHQTKREEAAARRAALFEAVRAARESRQLAREARQAELAKLETNATSLREKKLQSTVSRSAAQVKHALEVAANLREKEKEATLTAAARLTDRLSAASSRRQAALAATTEGATSVVQAAEKVRLRHLYDEKAAIEERRLRLAKAMDKALGRREAKLESITIRAAIENARVADVVADQRRSADTETPARIGHALTARLQAAQVRRLENLKKKPSAARVGGSSPKTSPKCSPASSLSASLSGSLSASPEASPSKTATPRPPWSSSSIHTSPTPALRLFKPEPVIVINTEPFHYAAPAPSSRLLSRLQFRPRIMLATAAARHAAAAGRRQTRLHLICARASHLGSVRVAVVRGRRAAMDAVGHAVFDVREKRGAARAAAHLRAKAKIAARFNERVTAAKLRRSSRRLQTLNAAITKEERRLVADGRRAAKLTVLKEGRWEEVKAFAVKVRRAAADERLVMHGAVLRQRCCDAASRRDAVLSAIVARARITSTRHAGPVKTESLAVKTETTVKTPATEAEGGEAKVTEPKAYDAKGEAATEAKAESTAEAITEAKAESDATESDAKATTKATAPELDKLPAGLPACEIVISHRPVCELDGRIAELQELLAQRTRAAVAAGKAEAEGLVEQRQELVSKAAEVSAAAAARAAARAEAKLEAKAAAVAVKEALSNAAAKAGLYGRAARTAADKQPAAPPSAASSSVASSAAASDTEEWHVVAEKM